MNAVKIMDKNTTTFIYKRVKNSNEIDEIN